MKKSFPIFWDWESGENLRPLFLGVGGNRNSRSPLNYVDGNGVGNVPQTSQRHSSWSRWKPPGEISNPHGLHERLKVVTLSQLELATHLEGYSCPRSYDQFYQQQHGWIETFDQSDGYASKLNQPNHVVTCQSNDWRWMTPWPTPWSSRLTLWLCTWLAP